MKMKSKILKDMIEESPDAVKKILRALKGEADDAVTKLGSGKNLSALKKAREEAPEMIEETLKDVDGYPKHITQDALAKKPVDPGFTMVPEGSQVPAVIPDEVLSATSNPNLPTVLKDAVEAPTSSSWKKMLAGGAGGIGLAGLGASMMGGEDDPSNPVMLTPPPKERPEIKDLGEKKTEDTVVEKPKNMMAQQKASAPVVPEQPEVLDYLEQLKQAQEADQDEKMWATLQRGATQIGAGIGGMGGALAVKPDYSGVEALEKNAGQNSSRVKEKMSTEKANKQLLDEQKMRDPKSDISKQLRGLLNKAGFPANDNVSAAQLKDMGVNVYNLLGQQEAQKSRLEMMKMMQEDRKASKEETNKLKIQSSVDRQVSQLLKSKDYEAYNQAKDAQMALNGALETGDKTAAGSAFMQFAKIAQGDNSVVRDGDMRVLAGGWNYTSPEQMLTKLSAKARGGDFNATELKQMMQVAQLAQKIKGARVQQLVSPIVNRSSAAGLNLDESLDPSVVEEFSNRNKEAQNTAPNNDKTERKIQKFMQNNPQVKSREEAIQILTQNGIL